jgi:hypothetical protein
MAIVLTAVALVAGITLTDGATPASTPPSSLTITYWPDERTPAEFERWTLRCNPLGGTLAGRRLACRRLSRLTPAAFAPVPADSVCTEIYGGPQKAVVKGSLGGKRIWASFRRRNGCEIDRWQRFSPWLLPSGGVSA